MFKEEMTPPMKLVAWDFASGKRIRDEHVSREVLGDG
jgi:hypothetical protein